MNKWDTRFLQVAATVASWSKDPSSQVGAVIVDGRNRVVSLGFNGPPRGVADDATVPREEKLRRTIHAEENALLFAGRDVEGCSIYITHPPCAGCAAKLIQAGVTRLAYLCPEPSFTARWGDDLRSAANMFREAGVEVLQVDRESAKASPEQQVPMELPLRVELPLEGQKWVLTGSALRRDVRRRLRALGAVICASVERDTHGIVWGEGANRAKLGAATRYGLAKVYYTSIWRAPVSRWSQRPAEKGQPLFLSPERTGENEVTHTMRYPEESGRG